MSNNLFNQYIELLNKASSSSNEAERKRLVDQANKICKNPEFTKSNTSSNSSNNGYNGLTNVDSGPGNAITPTGHAFGNIGYGFSHGGNASWT